MVLAVYWPAGNYPFINLDDDQYVYENIHVQRGLTWEGITWAFTTTYAANWHPLTWISHMMDVEMFGLDAGWHHRVNVFLHCMNTVLLFIVFRGMTGALWRSGFLAALFAVHPLHVESVAWVAERKDLLSTFFWFSTLGAYLYYVKRPGLRRHVGVLALFALGLMCKPMLVTLPLVLLLLDYWPLGRLTPATLPGVFSQRPLLSLIWEKAPLLALSTVSGIVTFMAQSGGGAVGTREYYPLGARVANAALSYAKYLVLCL
jgi:hypothetical protein